MDLNCDIGESYGAWRMGQDAQVMRWITSANIACGFHAGDFSTMQQTVLLAKQHGVAIGAHVSLPDLQGFGRREMKITPNEAYALTLYQLGALHAFARAAGTRVAHVKPHGALYNMAARDRELAEAIARAVFAFDAQLALYAPPRSALAAAGRAIGLRVVLEGFADRAYRSDGSLVPRSEPDAVIAHVEEVVNRAMQIAVERTVTAVDGTQLQLDADTICIHGDTPGAASMAAWIRAGLQSAGVDVKAPRA